MFSIGTTPLVELVALDGRDHLGNRALRHTLARREVGLGQQCFLGERAARPEIGHARHPRIVGEGLLASPVDTLAPFVTTDLS